MTDIATEQQMTTLPVLPKWTAYSSCEKLPLTVFIDCLLDNEYHKLITNWESLGEADRPGQQELHATWLPLYSEYATLSGNDAFAAIIVQVWQLRCLEAKINQVRTLLDGLLKFSDDAVIECLGLRGYIVSPYTNDDQWENQLRRLKGQLQGEQFQLKKLDKTLQSLKQKDTTKSDFRKQLISVTRLLKLGHRLRIEELTVAEYCEYLKAFKEEIDSLNDLNNGGED